MKVTLEQLAAGIELESNKHHRLVLLSPSTRVRLIGMFFDTNMDFMLPAALPGLRRLVRTYEVHERGSALVVGHTDSSKEDDYNEKLSLARAKAVVAYLKDDVDTWLERYEDGASNQWGAREDFYMLSAVPGFSTGTPGQNPVELFQASRGFDVDGICGPKTRRASITEYMSADGTTAPERLALVAHGCGEYFPSERSTGTDNSAPDRRVELFFFSGAIEPPPPGTTSKRGSTEYPRWVKQSARTIDLTELPPPFEFSV